jgi:hypothetical protein
VRALIAIILILVVFIGPVVWLLVLLVNKGAPTEEDYRMDLLDLHSRYMERAAKASAMGEHGVANIWQEAADNIAEELERMQKP